MTEIALKVCTEVQSYLVYSLFKYTEYQILERLSAKGTISDTTCKSTYKKNSLP